MSYRSPEQWVEPAIEKGIALPHPIRHAPGSYGESRSPWVPFLKKLVPGDSFVVHVHRLQMLSHIARILRIPLVTSRLDTEQARVWILSESDRPKQPKRRWNREKQVQENWPEAEPVTKPEVLPSLPPSQPPDLLDVSLL